MTNKSYQQELDRLKETFNNTVEKMIAGFEGALLQLSKMADLPDLEPLEVGSTVKFIGPSEEYHNDVTVGKTYVIGYVDRYGIAIFNDDVEEHSYINDKSRHLFESVPPAPFVQETNNEQRAALVERAKEFVNKHKRDEGIERNYGNSTSRYHHYETEFFVKDNKVTAVVYRLYHVTQKRESNKPYHVGRAKCMPGDVFNEWIGKAIALARALGIEVPEEFLNAVQPSRKHVKGMIVKFACGRLYEITMTIDDVSIPINEKIINDTNAEYEVASK